MKRFLALLVLLAAGVTAAALTVPDPAATVNGETISQSQLDADLSAIAGNSGYQCLLNAQIVVQSRGTASLPPIHGVGDGTYDTTFVGYWLSHMIDSRLVSQLARHHTRLTAADLATARTELVQSAQTTSSEVQGSPYQCQASPAAVYDSLPPSFVASLVREQATSDALLSLVPGSGVTTADLQRYFDQHRSQFETICVSGIIVADQSKAQQIQAQLQAGASFPQLAQANSLDTATASKGGSLGCFQPTSSQYPAVRQDIGQLQPGQVTQPLAGQGGSYILLHVDAIHPATFDQVRGAVRATVLEQGRTRTEALLTAAARRAHVSVNPSYGRWNPSSVTDGVQPPPSPPPSSVLSPGANQPSGGPSGSAGAGSGAGTG